MNTKNKLIIKDSLLKSDVFNITEDDDSITIEKKINCYRFFDCSLVVDTIPKIKSQCFLHKIVYDKNDHAIRILSEVGVMHHPNQDIIQLGNKSTAEIYKIDDNLLLLIINEMGVLN